MARRYDIERNRSLLYWGIGLFLLCIWCVRDGWFPTDSKAKEHTSYLAFQSTKGEWVSSGDAVKQEDKTWRTSEGKALESVTLKPDQVDREKLVVAQKPEISVIEQPDAFYFLFNKSFAILSAIGSLVCTLIYFLSK